VHFISDAAGLDEMPLAATMGEARHRDRRHREIAAELLPHDLQAGERVLFRTANSTRCWSISTRRRLRGHFGNGAEIWPTSGSRRSVSTTSPSPASLTAPGSTASC
jgi:hypothetical protein